MKQALVKAVFLFMCSVLLASCMNSVGNEIQATQTAIFPLASVDRAEVRLSRSGDDPFYYYVGGVRTPLTLSKQWIAVKFASPTSVMFVASPAGFGSWQGGQRLSVLQPLTFGLTLRYNF